MKTLLTDAIPEAADILRRGGLVAFPTETVFGLGADATNESAVRRLFDAKRRPSDNPLIVHLGRPQQWPQAARKMPEAASRILKAFAPGPITVVVPKHDQIRSCVTAGLDTVGLRIPGAAVAAEFLRLVGVPVAAPSANRSGRPSCTTWQSVMEDLDGRVDAVLRINVTGCGLESTVVDCAADTPILLRPGAITLEQLQAIVPQTRPRPSVAAGPHAGGDRGKFNSPGLLHPHYQPEAAVRLVETPRRQPEAGELDFDWSAVAYGGLEPHPLAAQLLLHRHYATTEEYALGFYEFLRAADRAGARTIYLQLAPGEGIGSALRDRQLRSAGEV